MPKSKSDPVTAAVADPLDAWAAILNPPFVPDVLDADEKTVAMLADELGKSLKISGDLLRQAYITKRVTRRRVRVREGEHPVYAYKPVRP